MPYSLVCAQSMTSPKSFRNASEADINLAFDDDRIRGEYVVLTAPDGSFLQAAGESDGPYVMEYHNPTTHERQCVCGDLEKEELREAFLQFLRGDATWRTSRNWEPVKTGGWRPALEVVAWMVALAAAVVVAFWFSGRL